WLDTAALEGLEVLGDDGIRVGRLVDATFDQDALDIQDYALRSTFWGRFIGRRGKIQPGKVSACSRELMMVQTGRLKELPATSDEDAHSLGVPLKVEDRLPAPSMS